MACSLIQFHLALMWQQHERNMFEFGLVSPRSFFHGYFDLQLLGPTHLTVTRLSLELQVFNLLIMIVLA